MIPQKKPVGWPLCQSCINGGNRDICAIYNPSFSGAQLATSLCFRGILSECGQDKRLWSALFGVFIEV